jgi:hypothetical protein
MKKKQDLIFKMSDSFSDKSIQQLTISNRLIILSV